MNSPEPHLQPSPTLQDRLRIRRNAIGLILMLAGIICLIIFHFSKGSHDFRGWQLWVNLAEFIANKEFLSEQEALLGYSGFVCLCIATLASPLLIGWLFHNAWIKWCLAAFSAMAASVMWYFMATEGDGLLLLLALSPSFTLAGLLSIETTPRHLPPSGPA